MIKVTVTNEIGKVLAEASGEYIVGAVATHDIVNDKVSTELGVMMLGNVSRQMYHNTVAQMIISTAKEAAEYDLETAGILNSISRKLQREIKRLLAGSDESAKPIGPLQ